MALRFLADHCISNSEEPTSAKGKVNPPLHKPQGWGTQSPSTALKVRQPLRKEKRKRDFILQNAQDGAEVSLRRPTHSQERTRGKNRPTPFEMTGTPGGAEARVGALFGAGGCGQQGKTWVSARGFWT